MNEEDRQLLIKEWEICENAIARFDSLLFQVKGWAMSAFGVTAAVAFTLHEGKIFVISASLVVAFWAIEANYKVYQTVFIRRSWHVQRALRGDMSNHNEANGGEVRGFPAISKQFEKRNVEPTSKRLKRFGRAFIELSVCFPFIIMILICPIGWLMTSPDRGKVAPIKVEVVPPVRMVVEPDVARARIEAESEKRLPK